MSKSAAVKNKIEELTNLKLIIYYLQPIFFSSDKMYFQQENYRRNSSDQSADVKVKLNVRIWLNNTSTLLFVDIIIFMKVALRFIEFSSTDKKQNQFLAT